MTDDAKSTDIYEALWEFTANPPRLVKSSTNPHFKNKYVPLEQVIERIIPRLRELGVMVLQPVHHVKGKPALLTILRHQPSGTALAYSMPLVMDRVAPQAQGSAITYARRYSLLSALGLVGDFDDDAQTAQPVEVYPSIVTTPSGSPFDGGF